MLEIQYIIKLYNYETNILYISFAVMAVLKNLDAVAMSFFKTRFFFWKREFIYKKYKEGYEKFLEYRTDLKQKTQLNRTLLMGSKAGSWKKGFGEFHS